jgi:hypothetical protein
MPPGDFIGLIAVLGVFGIPIVAIWTSHKQKIVEMQMKLLQQGDASVHASIEALRQEVQQLKDTTMQYDLSFDNALQRMEQRVEGLERRVNEVNSKQTVSIGRGD